ncbi:MAG: putative Fe2+ permease transmembrane component [Candidatus Desulfovibrio kirbyi]|uniref:Putative Fe2+ permease transmembrane component n=1 Tax=Candidatus Desulfovibrio kirbyi TaxID=2696086 RepID=A0A6L2R6T6_9BACT|nr:MAG: putative Fe2+ permease transmembrane component [Candidatus Desulfovibrio kirbyi]
MKKLVFSAMCLLFFSLPGARAESAPAYKTWNEITAEMTRILDSSYELYLLGDVESGKQAVNRAYFEFYEKLGVERAVLSYISGKRAATVEYQFAEVKRLMTESASGQEVRASLNTLARMLKEDADQLDGKKETPWGVFVASLLILLREGIEAILVVAAIAAYLIRSGNKRLTGLVYGSAVAAIVMSALLAVALQKLFSISGASQEMLEGFTMLLAVAVLFFVSNWMVSKAESIAWKKYIEDKIALAATTGSTVALAAASFLAVFREGAETILFYQALLADTREHMDMLWLGFAAACLCLVVVFAAVRFGSLHIPLRPFFIGTSILMYVMAVSFAGGGFKELQEADVVSVTPVSGIITVDILGIYPTVETLLPQAVMLVLAIVSFLFYTRRGAASEKAASE